jgi:hypothetical protein
MIGFLLQARYSLDREKKQAKQMVVPAYVTYALIDSAAPVRPLAAPVGVRLASGGAGLEAGRLVRIQPRGVDAGQDPAVHLLPAAQLPRRRRPQLRRCCRRSRPGQPVSRLIAAGDDTEE